MLFPSSVFLYRAVRALHCHLKGPMKAYTVHSFQYSGVWGTFLLVFPGVFSLFAAYIFVFGFVYFSLVFLVFGYIFLFFPMYLASAL